MMRRTRPSSTGIALFVDGDDLFVVEAGGPEEKLKAHEASVDKSDRKPRIREPRSAFEMRTRVGLKVITR